MILPSGLEELDSDEFVDSWKEYDTLFGDPKVFSHLELLAFVVHHGIDPGEGYRNLGMKLPTCDGRGILKVIPLRAGDDLEAISRCGG